LERKIISTLGDEVKILYGIIPKLKIILGEKDELVELNPNDAVIGFMAYGVIFQGVILGNHKLGYKYSLLAM
jgi:hypothetical protein